MVPSKSFFHLAAGAALVAITNRPSELSDILETSNVGVCVSPNDPAMLAAAILRLARDKATRHEMQSRARQLAEQRYSTDSGISAFTTILEGAGLVSDI
jgi:glycosyltransferase involved in cell wall biosynthesis